MLAVRAGDEEASRPDTNAPTTEAQPTSLDARKPLTIQPH